jgi:hypothetical protein
MSTATNSTPLSIRLVMKDHVTSETIEARDEKGGSLFPA